MPAYVLRISDWSSDVCSSDLVDLDDAAFGRVLGGVVEQVGEHLRKPHRVAAYRHLRARNPDIQAMRVRGAQQIAGLDGLPQDPPQVDRRAERRVGKEGVRTCRYGGATET